MLDRTLGVVLCGGMSRRFGAAKWEAVLGDRRLIDRVIGCQQQAFGEVIVVAGSRFAADVGQLPIVRDTVDGLGPASGIEAALGEADRRGFAGIWCLPCDAPFARPELGRRLAAYADQRSAAVFPESRGPLGFEPLSAWYSTSSREAISLLLRQGAPSMSTVARSIGRTQLLPLAEVEAIAPAELQFLNINTPEDMAFAQTQLRDDRS